MPSCEEKASKAPLSETFSLLSYPKPTAMEPKVGVVSLYPNNYVEIDLVRQ